MEDLRLAIIGDEWEYIKRNKEEFTITMEKQNGANHIILEVHEYGIAWYNSDKGKDISVEVDITEGSLEVNQYNIFLNEDEIIDKIMQELYAEEGGFSIDRY